jgi:hypothetical protein
VGFKAPSRLQGSLQKFSFFLNDARLGASGEAWQQRQGKKRFFFSEKKGKIFTSLGRASPESPQPK